MRKIEREMVNAIHAGKAWHKDNTRVTVNKREDGATITSVYLHGNLIAQTGKDGAWSFCLRGWNSPTTRSRINAIARVLECRAWGIASYKGEPVRIRFDYQAGEKMRAIREPIPLYDWFDLES